MNSLIRLKCLNDDRITYWVNPLHIIKVWAEGDGITRLELSNGKIIYPDVAPETVAEYVWEVSRK